MVSQAWGAIATSHLLDGFPDPRKLSDSQAHTRLDKRLTQKLKTYGLEDPPVQRENAIPLGIVHNNQKLDESELVDSIANKAPRIHKAMLISQGFNPETGDLETFVEHCEMA